MVEWRTPETPSSERFRRVDALENVSKNQQSEQIYRTRPFAVIVKPRAVTRMNECLALYHAQIWDDDTLNYALGTEILRGTMLTSYESVAIELTDRRSGRCVEFRMPGPGREGLTNAEARRATNKKCTMTNASEATDKDFGRMMQMFTSFCVMQIAAGVAATVLRITWQSDL
jgi:hypothetical protein